MDKKVGISEKLRDLIDLIDKLRDVGVNEVIKLPRIAVVGSQSAGKSSVLDSIVGFDILPKGDGVVTRCPLELRLHRLPAGSEQTPYALIAGSGGVDKRIDDLSHVQAEIVRLTNELAGTNQRIVEQAIVLSIYCHDCPDLTVVDLPGITRVPLKGSDQTADIEKITKNMALNYIKNERVIILAVVPGNQDATTTDALQLARIVDPEMKRTIGVVTKVDIMDKGTDAKELLLGNVVDMTLGFVAVKNRSKDDVLNGKTVHDALLDEEIFFRDHPVYSTLRPSLLGTKALVHKLSEEYRLHAKALLPKLKTEITLKKDLTEKELAALGLELSDNLDDLHAHAIHLTQSYLDQIDNIFDIRDLPNDLSQDLPHVLSNRARFRQICQTVFDVLNVDAAMKTVTDDKINNAIDLLDGDGLRGFRDPRIFKFLIKPLLKLIDDPVHDCLADVAELLESLSNLAATTAGPSFARFPEFQACMKAVAQETVEEAKVQAAAVVADFCAANTEYVYAFAGQTEPTFVRGVSQDTVDEECETRTDRDVLVEETRVFLRDYLTLVFAETKNVIPRMLGRFMVDAFLKNIKTKLYRVAASEKLSTLFQETQDTRVHRELLKSRKIALDKANALLRKYFSV